MKKIIFLGSKEIGSECLRYLVDHSSALDAQVIAVLTNDRSLGHSAQPQVKDICNSHQIPVLNSLDELIQFNEVDLLISVQYHRILKRQHLDKARQIAVNLHMAPLPEYRGCNQFSFAIIDKVPEFGTTIHRLEEKIDGGDILFEERFNVPLNADARWLYRKTYNASVNLFRERLADLISGNYQPVSQKSFYGKRKTGFYLRSDIEKIKKIDLAWDKEKILRHFRATYFPPFPLPYAMIDGQRVDVTPEWMAEMGYS